MSVLELYDRWVQKAVDDADLQAELAQINGNDDDIYDRFYRELEFGTAGLRGIIGAGDNRMNIYTVRKATQGLADYLNTRYTSAHVAVAYDSRIKSDLFAKEAARVLAANGIAVSLYAELQPVPLLSYTVRKLSCQAGIMVTASHNPAKYNGYKCYGSEGFQMTDDDANAVTECIRRIDMFDGVKLTDFDQAVANGTITLLDQTLVDTFLDEVAKQQVHPGICQKADLSVIYTPLNGAGNKPVRAALNRIGLEKVTVVAEQELPDGNFPTAPYPNPEIEQAFTLALTLAETVKPDLLLATDPDCDRVGIAVPNGDRYVLFTGNETGCLLLNYILSGLAEQGRLPQDPVVVKTIVTSNLATRIAEKYGCEMREVLTGFKYIGEQIGLLEDGGHPERYLLGFEESYGYLAGTHARDKDAVVASMLICEMAAYYKSKGQSLIDVLNGLYAEHGVYRHRLVNVQFEGAQGMIAMDNLMTRLRKEPPVDIAGLRVTARTDYLQSVRTDCANGTTTVIDLPKSNVLSYELEGNAGLIIRPSGTEPKVKGYVTAAEATVEASDEVVARLCEAAKALMK